MKAHYGERIRRNLDGVAREKATFGSWLKMKEQVLQGAGCGRASSGSAAVGDGIKRNWEAGGKN